MSDVVDNEMHAAMDTLYGLSISDAELDLKFAYCKGQIDFIHSIYELETLVKSPLEEESDLQSSRLSDKIKSIYNNIVGTIWR